MIRTTSCKQGRVFLPEVLRCFNFSPLRRTPKIKLNSLLATCDQTRAMDFIDHVLKGEDLHVCVHKRTSIPVLPGP